MEEVGRGRGVRVKRRIHINLFIDSAATAILIRNAVKNKAAQYDIYFRDVDIDWRQENEGIAVFGQFRLNVYGDWTTIRSWLVNQWNNGPYANDILAGSRIAFHDCRHEEPGTSWPACIEDDVLVK